MCCGCDPGRLLLTVLAALGWGQHPPVPGVTVLCCVTPLSMNTRALGAHTCAHLSLCEGRRSYYENQKFILK